MKSRLLGSATWLLIFGAALILLIGAFARFDSSGSGNAGRSSELVSPRVTDLQPGDATEPAGNAALPANLSPGLEEIIKLAQARVGDDVILAFVQNSGRIYNPTSDEILYLTDIGLSQKVLGALFARPTTDISATTASASSPPPPPGFDPAPSSELAVRTVSAPTQPAAFFPPARESLVSPPALAASDSQPVEDPATSYFYDALAPYGSWVDLGQDGWFWQPTVVTTLSDWQPYRDHGRWRYTDSGWYWQSDYSWGWAAFHYGRWLNHPRFGWVWNPGQTWGPAWVAWRNSGEYTGWAPLPPGAPFNFGSGPSVNSAGLDIGLALSASSFTFVAYNNFTASALASYAAPAGSVAAIFRASAPVKNYVVAGGKILNLGVSAEQIAAAIQRPVKQFALRDVSSASSANSRMRGGGLAVYRPAIFEKPAQPSLAAADLPESQPGQREELSVPVRDIRGEGGDASQAREDNRANPEIPRGPSPETPGWNMRRFSLSAGESRSPSRFAGPIAAPVGGSWSRPPNFGERGGGVPAADLGPRFSNGDARPSQDRPPSGEAHTAPSSATASKK